MLMLIITIYLQQDRALIMTTWFTKQLFIDLILPHVEGGSLLTMRQLSKAIKIIANQRLFVFIKTESKRIRDEIVSKLPDKFIAQMSHSYLFDDRWQPRSLSAYNTLLYFNVFHDRYVITFRYNLFTANVKIGEKRYQNWFDRYDDFPHDPIIIGQYNEDHLVEIIVKQFITI